MISLATALTAVWGDHPKKDVSSLPPAESHQCSSVWSPWVVDFYIRLWKRLSKSAYLMLRKVCESQNCAPSTPGVG